MSGSAHDTLGWLAAREGAMLALLADLVGIDSGTRDVAGVTAVGSRLAAFFQEHDVPVARINHEGFGAGLQAELASEGADAPVLLMGHLDTVFPVGEAARRPFRIEHGRAYGPGVADMKAGLVMNSFVLAALSASGGSERPVAALFTGDEEIGSPGYRPTIEAAAKQAAFAFNAEPGRANGNLVVERRGGTFMRLTVHGRAAHSGVDLREGVNAIAELAYKIVALHELTDYAAGLTVNVGVVSGGQSVNTTAPHAEALIDLRFGNTALRETALARIEAICSRNVVPNASASLGVTGEFLPLSRSAATLGLLDLYKIAADELGFTVEGEATGGCADSGLASAAGAATLCATGPVGGRAHTAEEYIETPTLLRRAQALALTIHRLPSRPDDFLHRSTVEG